MCLCTNTHGVWVWHSWQWHSGYIGSWDENRFFFLTPHSHTISHFDLGSRENKYNTQIGSSPFPFPVYVARVQGMDGVTSSSLSFKFLGFAPVKIFGEIFYNCANQSCIQVCPFLHVVCAEYCRRGDYLNIYIHLICNHVPLKVHPIILNMSTTSDSWVPVPKKNFSDDILYILDLWTEVRVASLLPYAPYTHSYNSWVMA